MSNVLFYHWYFVWFIYQNMSVVSLQVPVRPGVTLKEALAKALKLRELIAENCAVYRINPRTPVSWDTDIAHLAGLEISVEQKEHIPLTSISHNFVSASHNFVSTAVFVFAPSPILPSPRPIPISLMLRWRWLATQMSCHMRDRQ